MATIDLIALPVSLDLPRALHDDVQRHLEGAMGWQVTTSPDLPARLHLVGVGRRANPGVPSVLVVGHADDPATAARSALGTAAVIRWPEDAAEVAATAARLLAMTPARAVPTLRVAGSAGGVGTSTIALAVAGLVAWRGFRVLAVSSSDLAVPGVPEVTTLRGPRPWEAAVDVPGVPGLKAVRALPGDVPAVVGPDLVVEDGRFASPHVLVAAADRVGVEAVRAAEAGTVAVVARGPLRAEDIGVLAGSRLAAVLPWSHRVARAGLHRRVPASLPGAYVAGLQRLADRICRELGR